MYIIRIIKYGKHYNCNINSLFDETAKPLNFIEIINIVKMSIFFSLFNTRILYNIT